jgi:hypothetical protein
MGRDGDSSEVLPNQSEPYRIVFQAGRFSRAFDRYGPETSPGGAYARAEVFNGVVELGQNGQQVASLLRTEALKELFVE